MLREDDHKSSDGPFWTAVGREVAEMIWLAIVVAALSIAGIGFALLLAGW